MEEEIGSGGVVQVMVVESFEDVFLWVAELLDLLDDCFFEDYVFCEELLLVEVAQKGVGLSDG